MQEELNREQVARMIVDCAFHLHRDLGPGLLESVYEAVLARQIQEKGLRVERQKPVPIVYAGVTFDEGFRADIIVEDQVLVELKSVENLARVHSKQVLTYLRLLKKPLGLLINFGAATFKEGCHRILNGPQTFVSSCLRVNQTAACESGTGEERLTRRHEGKEQVS
jgi:iron complex transport system substrate-binding protein